MAGPNERTSTSAADANRARMQGLGSGQREMDAARDPSRTQDATAKEQRSFDRSLDGATGADRPSQADFGDGDAGSGRAADAGRRDDAGPGSPEAALGEGVPANVDVHKLGMSDRPEEDWGEPGDPEAVFSSNHTRRGERTEAVRGQGGKTRKATKDIISRRG